MMFLHLILYSLLIILKRIVCEVVEYDFNSFPKDLVSLHMPCEESNMFATKCMCHIKCTDPKCNNARSLCSKYER
jgi:hypothetical protein